MEAPNQSLVESLEEIRSSEIVYSPEIARVLAVTQIEVDKLSRLHFRSFASKISDKANDHNNMRTSRNNEIEVLNKTAENEAKNIAIKEFDQILTALLDEVSLITHQEGDWDNHLSKKFVANGYEFLAEYNNGLFYRISVTQVGSETSSIYEGNHINSPAIIEKIAAFVRNSREYQALQSKE